MQRKDDKIKTFVSLCAKFGCLYSDCVGAIFRQRNKHGQTETLCIIITFIFYQLAMEACFHH